MFNNSRLLIHINVQFDINVFLFCFFVTPTYNVLLLQGVLSVIENHNSSLSHAS